MSPQSKITNRENFTQFKQLKKRSSDRVNAMLIKNTKLITLHDSLLTLHDSGKEFESKGDLSKMISNKNYNVNHASLADKKLLYDLQKKCIST